MWTKRDRVCGGLEWGVGKGSRSKRQETQPSVPKAETILVMMESCWPEGSALDVRL